MESTINMIKKFLAPPLFVGDEEKTRIASLLNTILLTQLFVAAVPAINLALMPDSKFVIIALLVTFFLPLAAMLYLMRRGFVRQASIAVIVFLMVTAALLGIFSGGKPLVVITYYPLIIVIAGLLLGGNSAIITAIISSVVLGIITYAGAIGIFKEMLPMPPTAIAIFTYAIGFVLIGIVLRLASQGLASALKRARESERQLRASNRELQELSASLEQSVTDRTEELTKRSQELQEANISILQRAERFEAIVQVTRAITSIRDLQELLPRIATVISERLGFYHVGVFLLDDVNEYAILSATNSEGGRKMLERKHRLRVGEQGIVGNVTDTGTPRVAMDVGVDATFFTNPELPDTHSEMALPLKTGDQIIGALDVQSTERGAFSADDIQMLGLLANQVSVAIENARLFEETRKALSESEAASRQSTREVWRSLPVEQNLFGYRYTVTGASPLHEAVQITESTEDQKEISSVETARVVLPIQLRGETIGMLVVQSPSPSQLHQDQLDLIKAVAERVAISAENARLFDETTRRAERERTVSNITSKIRSVNDPQIMIQTAIEELRNALGASRVEVIPQTIQGAAKQSE
jgi:GAF domain-containing protein